MNTEPATEIDEMVSGALPEEVNVTALVAVCPTSTDPNATLVLLIVIAGADAFSWIAKLFAMPFAVPVMLAVFELLTAAMVAANDAEEAPAGTVVEAGTEAAVSLLLNETRTPPVGAGALRLTTQLSVSAPVTTASLHDSPATPGATPLPPMLTVAVPAGASLKIVANPVKEPAWSGLNASASVAVWPGFSVRGAATPVTWKGEPATEIDEIVSGAFPDDVSVTALVAVCPTFTAPNDIVVLLTESTGL